jgi:3-phytase
MLSFFITTIILYSCNNINTYHGDPNFKQLNDSVAADVETVPVNTSNGVDAADDPAIWIHPTDPGKSLIVGTNKKAGLLLYDLDGRERQFLPVGNVNNVDVRYGFEFSDGTMGDIIGCTERIENKVIFFVMDTSSLMLEQLEVEGFHSSKPEIYGFCMYKNINDGKMYAFANFKPGFVTQWELLKDSSTSNQKIIGKVAREIKLASQPEGMVADDELNILYIGEEERGIWKTTADPLSNSELSFIPMSDTSNQHIEYDIEGLTMYSADEDKGYLIASSQGNYSYAIFERSDSNKYIGSFVISPGRFDGAEETDGIDVTSIGLGNAFPHGLFVVQDGFNFDDGKMKSQNFKLVSWKKIAHLFEPPLIIADHDLTDR